MTLKRVFNFFLPPQLARLCEIFSTTSTLIWPSCRPSSHRQSVAWTGQTESSRAWKSPGLLSTTRAPSRTTERHLPELSLRAYLTCEWRHTHCDKFYSIALDCMHQSNGCNQLYTYTLQTFTRSLDSLNHKKYYLLPFNKGSLRNVLTTYPSPSHLTYLPSYHLPPLPPLLSRGLYLQDLTFIEMQPKLLEDGVSVNFTKRWKQFKSVDHIRFAQTKYAPKYYSSSFVNLL